MISFPIFILIGFWAIYIIGRLLFCLYFWQIKEYRLDRVLGDFKKSFAILVPKTAYLMVFALLLLLLPQDSNNPNLWDNFVAIVFCGLGIYSIYKLSTSKWKFPKFTKKALALLTIYILCLLLLTIIFSANIALYLVFADLFIPLGTLLVVLAFQIPTNLYKNKIYKQAEERIKKLKRLKIIAINGSYGKSSTKEFLYTILSKKYKVLKTSGNVNTEIGVAQTILKELDNSYDIFIVEMGAYRKGEIKTMCQMAKPNIGIVTGINEQHLGLFGSMENLISAEGGGELSEALQENGILFVNGDNKYCLELLKKNNVPPTREKIYTSKKTSINSDIWSEDLAVYKNYISFIAHEKHGELAHFKVNVLGGQNMQNLLGAILVAKELGMNFTEIMDACKIIKPQQAGMVLKEGNFGIEVIDSSYSANPDGVLADLNYLSTFPGKKVIVMPCLIELGKKSAETHQKIGKKIAETCDLAIITTKDNFKDIEKGYLERIKLLKVNERAGKEKLVLCDKSSDIHAMITVYCKQGDAVLLEGRVPSALINLLTK